MPSLSSVLQTASATPAPSLQKRSLVDFPTRQPLTPSQVLDQGMETDVSELARGWTVNSGIAARKYMFGSNINPRQGCNQNHFHAFPGGPVTGSSKPIRKVQRHWNPCFLWLVLPFALPHVWKGNYVFTQSSTTPDINWTEQSVKRDTHRVF